jgi:hypothetical protein
MLHGWMPEATDTNSEYVILIPFPQQQWLQERASMLRYTYIACLLHSMRIVHRKTSDHDSRPSL